MIFVNKHVYSSSPMIDLETLILLPKYSEYIYMIYLKLTGVFHYLYVFSDYLPFATHSDRYYRRIKRHIKWAMSSRDLHSSGR